MAKPDYQLAITRHGLYKDALVPVYRKNLSDTGYPLPMDTNDHVEMQRWFDRSLTTLVTLGDPVQCDECDKKCDDLIIQSVIIAKENNIVRAYVAVICNECESSVADVLQHFADNGHKWEY
jgi:hypothetical protein